MITLARVDDIMYTIERGQEGGGGGGNERIYCREGWVGEGRSEA